MKRYNNPPAFPFRWASGRYEGDKFIVDSRGHDEHYRAYAFLPEENAARIDLFRMSPRRDRVTKEAA